MAITKQVFSGPSPWRSNGRTTFISVLCYAVALGGLVWVFSGINWHELWLEINHAGVRWMIVAALFQFVSDVCHAWRWNLLLRSVSRLKLWRTLRALHVGLFANEVLPLRPGELIRPYLVAGWNRIAFSVVASSVVLERLLDGLSLFMAFTLTTAFVSLPTYLIVGVRVLAGLLVVAAFLLLLLVWKMRDGAALPSRLTGWLRHATEGIRRMANARSLALCFTASVVQLGLQGMPYWALNKSFRLDLSAWEVIAVLIIVRASTAIPNAPGNAGLLQVACVLALGLFGIDKTRATGFAALLFVALTLPLLIGGAMVAMSSGVRIRELRQSTAELAAMDSSSL